MERNLPRLNGLNPVREHAVDFWLRGKQAHRENIPAGVEGSTSVPSVPWNPKAIHSDDRREGPNTANPSWEQGSKG